MSCFNTHIKLSAISFVMLSYPRGGANAPLHAAPHTAENKSTYQDQSLNSEISFQQLS